jgi:septal ring factor EnvC (AmiA/AmiB activator)
MVMTVAASDGNHYFCTDDSTNMPTSTDNFAMGFGTAAARDLKCREMAAFVLHVPSGATTVTKTLSLDAALQKTFQRTASLDAALQQDFTETASLDAALADAKTRTASLNAAIQQLKTATTDLDAALLETTALRRFGKPDTDCLSRCGPSCFEHSGGFT